MRKKTEIIILNILTLFFLCFTYWLGNCYPRRIFEWSGASSILAMVWSFLFHLLYFFFLCVCFIRKDTVFTKNTLLGSGLSFAERFYVKEIALLMIVQLFFDALRFGLNTISHPAMPLMFGALTALCWYAFYGILKRTFSRAKK